MPGRWLDGRWQPFDVKCQLEEWPASPAGSPLHILFVGDSVERFTAQDVTRINGSICCVGELSTVCAAECSKDSLVTLSSQHLNGVWPEGPYFMQESHPLTSAQAWQNVRGICHPFASQINQWSYGLCVSGGIRGLDQT